GFFGGERGVDHLHSHILGVEDPARAGGVGFALKLHQRAWALDHGLHRVTWTYDPLVRANGYFNMAKLGALGSQYLVNFYGAMDDSINSGDQSDRILITWNLGEARVERACAGALPPLDFDDLVRRGAVALLEVGADERP